MPSVVNTIHGMHSNLAEILRRRSNPIHEHAKAKVEDLHRAIHELIEHITLTHAMDLTAHSQHELRHAANELLAADRAFAGGQDTKGWSHLESALGPLSEITTAHPKEGLGTWLHNKFKLHN